MSLLKTNEIQNYNGSSLTLTASTVSTSAQLNTGGNISVTGSLNVSDDSTTRTNLGLGSIATQAANSIDIDGGAIDGTTIGGITAAAGSFTTFTSTGIDDNASSTAITIDSSGHLLVNTSSTLLAGAGSIQVQSIGTGGAIIGKSSEWSTYTQYIWNSTTANNSRLISFGTEGSYTERGSIDFNRGATLTRYNTTSDAKLKNIIGDSDGKESIQILKTTRIRDYAWKEDVTQKTQVGVIAQELRETYKGAVSVGGEDAQGNYRPWMVDKTAFTFHLIAGWQAHEKIIQEQQTQIDALTARIEALETT